MNIIKITENKRTFHIPRLSAFDELELLNLTLKYITYESLMRKNADLEFDFDALVDALCKYAGKELKNDIPDLLFTHGAQEITKEGAFPLDLESFQGQIFPTYVSVVGKFIEETLSGFLHYVRKGDKKTKEE